MFDAVGHPVDRLRRVRIGSITDEHIRPGEFRELDAKEIAALKRAAVVLPDGRRPDVKVGHSRGGHERSSLLPKKVRPETDQAPHRRRAR